MSEPTIEEYKKRIESFFEWPPGTPRKLEDYETTDCLMLLDEWISSVQQGMFIDYDGYGYFVAKQSDELYIVGNISIFPSDIKKLKMVPPKWATHVLWYNR